MLETCFIFSLLAVVFHHYSTLRAISTWCGGQGVKVIFIAWSRGQRVFLGGSGQNQVNEGKWKWRNGNEEMEMETEMRTMDMDEMEIGEAKTSYTNLMLSSKCCTLP